MIRGMDLYPTLAALAGVPIKDPKALDGVDHLPAILGEAAAPELEWNGIFVYYGGYRDNQWKLIAKAGSSELYDLKQDPSEKDDVSIKFPEITRRLRAKHDSWLKKHGANVNYTPPAVKGPHIARPAGEVLEVRWAAPTKSGRAELAFPLAGAAAIKARKWTAEDQVCAPGDCLVYDMKIESMQSGQSAYISPLRGQPIFGGARGTGVDADGVRISSNEILPGPLKEWKRFVLGLGNSAALNLSDLRLVVESRKNASGDIHLSFDNIHILKADGRVLSVWDGGSAPSGDSLLTTTTIDLLSPSH